MSSLRSSARSCRRRRSSKLSAARKRTIATDEVGSAMVRSCLGVRRSRSQMRDGRCCRPASVATWQRRRVDCIDHLLLSDLIRAGPVNRRDANNLYDLPCAVLFSQKRGNGTQMFASASCLRGTSQRTRSDGFARCARSKACCENHSPAAGSEIPQSGSNVA